MKKIGDKVDVHCTDTGKTLPGVLHKFMGPDTIVVVIQSTVTIQLKKLNKANLYVGSRGGLEFTVSL